MPEKPTYEELERRVRELEAAEVEWKKCESEQKKMETALRQSESRLKQAQRVAKIGSWDMNAETGDGLWSDELFRLLGYQPGEKTASYNLFREHVHPEDVHKFEESITEYTGRAKHVDEIFRFLTKSGDVRFAHSIGHVEFDEAGKPLRAYGTFQDITDGKRLETEIADASENLSSIIEALPDILFEVDSTGRIYDYHAPSDDMLYVRPELFLNKNFSEVVPPNVAAVIQQAISEALIKGRHCGATYMLNMPSGLNWYELSIAVKAKRSNHSVRLVVLARNITERKRAEESFKASERKFKNIADNLPGLVLRYKLNPDGSDELLYISKGVTAMYGVSPEDAIKNNKLLWNRIHRDDLEEYKASIQESAENLSLWEEETRIQLPDGRIKWLHSCGVPVKQEDGSVVWDTLAIDVTERKLTEKSLQESEAQKTAILNGITVNIAFVNQNLEILWLNKAAADSINKNPEEMIGRRCHEFWGDPEVPCPNCPTFRAFHSRKSEHITVVTPDGRIWDEKGEPVFNSEGDLIGVVEIAEDITDRKRAEAALQKSLAEKEVLLREIHHRVKNNMQAISGLLRMHARRTDDVHLTEVFNDCWDRIGAMSLIHEALYQSENLAKIDFEAYLKKLCRNLAQAHDARRKGITLTASAADVSLDMDQGVAVGMIIAELISNAFKHAFPDGEGGAVSVHLDRPDGETVRLMVSDTGKGLPDDFDIRNPPSLGMRLVSGAVTRELGGSIEAVSDGGAKFVIRFKCEKAIEMARGEKNA